MSKKSMADRRINYFIDTAIPTDNPSMVHVMKMCQAFTKCGLSVTLFCNNHSEVLDIQDVFRQYGVVEQFDVKAVTISDFLKKYGHRIGAYYSAWLKTRYVVKGYAYSRSAMSLFFLKKKVKFVFEAHLEPDLVSRYVEYSILRHENCRGLVVISQALKNRYMALFPFFPEEKITVLHDAADIDVSGAMTKAELQGPDAKIKIGYIGSLFPGKCMETLLPLARRCPQYYFHIVGGTEYWVDYWKKQAEAAGVKNLMFYGHMENSKLGDYYRAFDICILPFSKDIHIGKSKRVNIGQWTSPLKLFEAMAYEKPIIVSRLETIQEVMVDHEDCIMVEPDNIDDWEKKLIALCEDKELQQRIGHAALEKLSKEYTWTERARRAAEILL